MREPVRIVTHFPFEFGFIMSSTRPLEWHQNEDLDMQFRKPVGTNVGLH